MGVIMAHDSAGPWAQRAQKPALWLRFLQGLGLRVCRVGLKTVTVTNEPKYSQSARRILFIEFADWTLGWCVFVLAFHAADLQFDNDPDHVLRTVIMALCVLSTVSWLCECMLCCADPEKFCSLAHTPRPSTLPTCC